MDAGRELLVSYHQDGALRFWKTSGADQIELVRGLWGLGAFSYDTIWLSVDRMIVVAGGGIALINPWADHDYWRNAFLQRDPLAFTGDPHRDQTGDPLADTVVAAPETCTNGPLHMSGAAKCLATHGVLPEYDGKSFFIWENLGKHGKLHGADTSDGEDAEQGLSPVVRQSVTWPGESENPTHFFGLACLYDTCMITVGSSSVIMTRRLCTRSTTRAVYLLHSTTLFRRSKTRATTSTIV